MKLNVQIHILVWLTSVSYRVIVEAFIVTFTLIEVTTIKNIEITLTGDENIQM